MKYVKLFEHFISNDNITLDIKKLSSKIEEHEILNKLNLDKIINESYVNALYNHPYLTPNRLYPNVKIDNKSDEYLAVQLYQNGYIVTDVQKFLRTSKFPSKKETDVIKLSVELIDKAFLKSPKLPKETELWRGVDGLNFYSSSSIDKGYTSTAQTLNATVKDWSINGKILRILAPKGMNYIDMNKYLKKSDIDGSDQEEFLLPRGLKFELDSTYSDYETYRVKK